MGELAARIHSMGGLSRSSLAQLEDQIREVYLGDTRPWVIGYSGGKDSTTTLQLVWSALAALPAESRRKPVFVISSDTLVETPKIVDYINGTLARINARAKVLELPITAHKVSPVTNDTFWVNLLGRGYPVPSKLHRRMGDRTCEQIHSRARRRIRRSCRCAWRPEFRKLDPRSSNEPS